MRKLLDSRRTAQGATAAPAGDAGGRPPKRFFTPSSFAFLTAEGGQRYRVDELLREVGRRGLLWSRAAPVAWGFGGFLIGALCWYVIGVWGLLGGVLHKGPGTALSVVARDATPAVLPNCTTLALDRANGRTYSVSCPDSMPAIEEASRPRQDFAEAELR